MPNNVTPNNFCKSFREIGDALDPQEYTGEDVMTAIYYPSVNDPQLGLIPGKLRVSLNPVGIWEYTWSEFRSAFPELPENEPSGVKTGLAPGPSMTLEWP